MKQSQLTILQKLYDSEQNSSTPLSFPSSEVSKHDISFLKREGYIVEPFTSLGAYHLSLTEKGELFVKNGYQTPTTAINFNFNNSQINNSVVGNNASGNQFTMESYRPLKEIESIINSKPSEEQSQLNEMLEILREIQCSKNPVDKGRLSRFYEFVKKGTDLFLPVSEFLVDIFFRNAGK